VWIGKSGIVISFSAGEKVTWSGWPLGWLFGTLTLLIARDTLTACASGRKNYMRIAKSSNPLLTCREYKSHVKISHEYLKSGVVIFLIEIARRARNDFTGSSKTFYGIKF
jgi:hypothetical protein